MERAQLVVESLSELRYILELSYLELEKNEPSWVSRVRRLLEQASDIVPPVMPGSLDSDEFYELMQSYRFTPVSDQDTVVQAFENVKNFVRTNFA